MSFEFRGLKLTHFVEMFFGFRVCSLVKSTGLSSLWFSRIRIGPFYRCKHLEGTLQAKALFCCSGFFHGARFRVNVGRIFVGNGVAIRSLVGLK
jgi:hypothetical protein